LAIREFDVGQIVGGGFLEARRPGVAFDRAEGSTGRIENGERDPFRAYSSDGWTAE
jgi:hypothetical protein